MTYAISLDGRNALVTGASSGLGRYFAQSLARAAPQWQSRRAGATVWSRFEAKSQVQAAKRSLSRWT